MTYAGQSAAVLVRILPSRGNPVTGEVVLCQGACRRCCQTDQWGAASHGAGGPERRTGPHLGNRRRREVYIQGAAPGLAAQPYLIGQWPLKDERDRPRQDREQPESTGEWKISDHRQLL
ncbi:predicted protein [Histoplasma capsulatum H143]|uniref:Uncharacterized protein n=1 Tax=Ajellomyces capsulatus (strain H143) TaxID=544712 RepID=C6HPW3_AJECH|nr:predicted protein [Histoplasma capsulatum H143]